ncbi:MAG: hypothetical protein IPJ51_10785 [Saprospiraceae bacterium]|nr:hypothetical protein [Saprospiraceae bacterium]
MELVLLESHGIFKKGDTFKYKSTFFQNSVELYSVQHIETGANIVLYSWRFAPMCLTKEELARIDAVNKP